MLVCTVIVAIFDRIFKSVLLASIDAGYQTVGRRTHLFLYLQKKADLKILVFGSLRKIFKLVFGSLLYKINIFFRTHI